MDCFFASIKQSSLCYLVPSFKGSIKLTNEGLEPYFDVGKKHYI